MYGRSSCRAAVGFPMHGASSLFVAWACGPQFLTRLAPTRAHLLIPLVLLLSLLLLCFCLPACLPSRSTCSRLWTPWPPPPPRSCSCWLAAPPVRPRWRRRRRRWPRQWRSCTAGGCRCGVGALGRRLSHRVLGHSRGAARRSAVWVGQPHLTSPRLAPLLPRPWLAALQIRNHVLRRRTVYHVGVMSAPEDLLPRMTNPDDAVRVFSFMFALIQVGAMAWGHWAAQGCAWRDEGKEACMGVHSWVFPCLPACRKPHLPCACAPPCLSPAAACRVPGCPQVANKATALARTIGAHRRPSVGVLGRAYSAWCK